MEKWRKLRDCAHPTRAGLQRQPHNSIPPLRCLGGDPDQKQLLNDCGDRRGLRYQEHAWRVPMLGQEKLEMTRRHRTDVMRDQDTSLLSCNGSHIRVLHAFGRQFLSTLKIDGRLSSKHTRHDIEVQISVRQESRLHPRRAGRTTRGKLTISLWTGMLGSMSFRAMNRCSFRHPIVPA